MTEDSHPLDKRNEPAPEPQLRAPDPEKKRADRALDKELEATFPASDPPATTQPTGTEPAGDPSVKP